MDEYIQYKTICLPTRCQLERGISMLEQFKAALIRQGASENTISAYTRNVHLFLEWYEQSTGNPFDNRITVFDGREYKAYLNTVKKQSPNSINAKLTAVQRYADFLASQGLQERLTISKQKSSRQPDVKILDKPTLYKCRRWVHAYGSKRDAAIFETLLNTGLRESELVQAELDDIDIGERKGALIVRHGKGGKIRKVPLNADARKALTDYLRARPAAASKRIFIGQRGPINRNALYKIVRNIGKRGAGAEIYPHELRHTCFSAMIQNGVPLTTVAELAGHSDPKTTADFYVAKSIEQTAEAVEKLQW